MVPTRCCIAHISDPHFCGRTPRSVLEQLEDILVAARPNALIVTGDLADEPRQRLFDDAHRWLVKATAKCGDPELLVMPGNHDYLWKGVLGAGRFTRDAFNKSFPLSTPFQDAASFSEIGAAVPYTTPYTGQFTGGEWRCLQEPASRDALWLWTSKRLGLAIFVFDSNPVMLQVLAAGEVDFAAIRALDAFFASADSRRLVQGMTRIALVHHHPLPTRYRPAGRFDRVSDSFMTFYNAGHFLKALCDHHFQLVLHGHRHFANVARYGTGDVLGKSLAVVGAGTAAHPALDDARGYHLNLINIGEDDVIQLESRFFSDADSRLEATRPYTLRNLYEVGQTRFHEASADAGSVYISINKKVIVTGEGYSKITIRKEATVRRGTVTEEKIDIVAPAPAYIRGVKLDPEEGTPSEFHVLDPKPARFRCYEGVIDLGEPTGSFACRYSYRLMNGHAVSPQELQRKYGTTQPYEYVSWQCEEACERLELSVELPKDSIPQGIEVRVQFRPVSTLLDHEDGGPSNVFAAWEDHAEERQRLMRSLQQDRENNRIRLICDNPIRGFLYRIRWTLASAVEEPHSLLAEGKVIAGKQRLLDLLHEAQSAASLPPVLGRVCDTLAEFSASLNSFFSWLGDETLEASLMVFEEEERVLQMVASNAGTPAEWRQFKLASGEGLAGFAFDKGRIALFHQRRDSLGYFITQEEMAGAGRIQTVLVSLPWVYEGILLGTLSIGSPLVESELAALFDLGAEAQEDELQILAALTYMCGESILKTVRSPNASAIRS